MFEQAFKNIDDVLRKKAGCTTEPHDTEQTSWLLFLKYLDGLQQDKADEFSHLYEAKIGNMGNAGRNGSEHYPPRPLIRAIGQAVQPRIGGRIYDGAVGSAGFLCEPFDFKILKAGRRGGMVIGNTFLSNTGNASVSLRKLDPGRNLGKTHPFNDAELAEFIELRKTFADSPKSWSVDAKAIDPATFDLSMKNPNGGEAFVRRSPEDIDEIAALDAESAAVLETIRGLL
jgi:N-6 DNA Methylase